MREGDDDSNNEHGLLRYNGPHRYLTSAPSFNENGVLHPHGDDDSNNEHGLLRYNGPHRYLTSAPSFNGEISSLGVQIIKAIKLGNVKIYGIHPKADKVKEEDAQ